MNYFSGRPARCFKDFNVADFMIWWMQKNERNVNLSVLNYVLTGLTKKS